MCRRRVFFLSSSCLRSILPFGSNMKRNAAPAVPTGGSIRLETIRPLPDSSSSSQQGSSTAMTTDISRNNAGKLRAGADRYLSECRRGFAASLACLASGDSIQLVSCPARLIKRGGGLAWPSSFEFGCQSSSSLSSGAIIREKTMRGAADAEELKNEMEIDRR